MIKSLKSRKTIYAVVLIVTVIALCLGLLAADPFSMHAAVTVAEETGLKDNYRLGETVEISKDVTFTANGESYSPTKVVFVSPDGSTYSAGRHLLETLGEYTVRYYYVDKAGKSSIAEKSFTVTNKNYMTSSDSSKVEFSEDDKTLSVTLVDGDTFYYNVPFNVNAHGLTEIINYAPNFVIREDKPVYEITVRITDAYDPSIYVDFIATIATETGNAFYLRAGSNNQRATGLELRPDDEPIRPSTANSRHIRLNGKLYLLHYQNSLVNYGNSSRYYGPENAPFIWTYDPDTMWVYKEVSTYGVAPVTDLNESDFHGEDIFGGFKTGEVYLSMFASDYVKNSVNIKIASIFGTGGEDLRERNYKDETGPSISIDANLTDINGVYGVKGTRFKIPDATAVDINLTGGVTTKVYRNYASDRRISVNVSDNSFALDETGVYTIVYEARDLYGNVGRELLHVNCLDKDQSGEKMNDAIDISVWTPQSEYKAGYDEQVPECSYRGVNNEISFEITAVSPSGKKEKINTVSRKFVPTEIGEYEIIYTCRDNVYTVSKSVKLTVVSSDKVRFVGEPLLYDYFIKDYTYALEPFTAYEFSGSAAAPVATALAVKFDDGDWQNASFDSIEIKGEETVMFKYSAVGAEDYVTDEYRIINSKTKRIINSFGQEIEVEVTDYSTFFVGDFEKTAGSANTRFVSRTTTGTNTLDYINPVSSRYFALHFVLPENAAYNKLRINIGSFYDKTEAGWIELSNANGKVNLRADNGCNVKTEISFTDGGAFSLVYNANISKFTLNNTLRFDYVFPFERDACSVSVDIGDFSAGGSGFTDEQKSLYISQLCNAQFTTGSTDISNPIISVPQVGGYYAKGSVVKIYGAEAIDVISPIDRSALNVRVLYDGAVVTANDGTALNGAANDVTKEYSFTLDKLGYYRVIYSATDNYGNVSEVNYSFIVRDETAPAISLKKVEPNSVVNIKVNKEYKIAEYSINDEYNQSGELAVAVLIVRESNYSKFAITDGKFKPTEKGYYTVYYYCVDPSGNSSTVSYRLFVK